MVATVLLVLVNSWRGLRVCWWAVAVAAAATAATAAAAANLPQYSGFW